MRLIRATVVEVDCEARSVVYRTDNGPGVNQGVPHTRGCVIPGVGPVFLRDDGRVVEADSTTPTAIEAARYYNRGIGSWMLGTSVPAPTKAPGLAFPGANRHNPAPCGGGYVESCGEWVPATVIVRISDYDTRRPHPA